MSSCEVRKHDEALRWGTRIFTLAAAAYWWVYLIPLPLALIAWRWHLLGGMLLVLASFAGYVRLATMEGSQWLVYVMLIPLFISGILNIAMGLRDRSHRAPQPG